jgi:hypothetical protein
MFDSATQFPFWFAQKMFARKNQLLLSCAMRIRLSGRNKKMSRSHFVRFSALILALALVLPAVTSLALAKEAKGTVKTDVTIANSVWLAGKELKAGEYSIVADDAKVTVSHNGKMIVEAPIQWQDGRGKAEASSVVLEGNKVKEIRFGGKTRAAVLQL